MNRFAILKPGIWIKKSEKPKEFVPFKKAIETYCDMIEDNKKNEYSKMLKNFEPEIAQNYLLSIYQSQSTTI